MRVVHPMSGTGFPFSLPAAADCCVLFAIISVSVFSPRLPSRSQWLLWARLALIARCLVSPIIPDKSTCLAPIARKAVGLFQ